MFAFFYSTKSYYLVIIFFAFAIFFHKYQSLKFLSSPLIVMGIFSFLAINYLRKTTKKIISQAGLVALGNVVSGRVVEVRKLRTKNKISYEFIIEGNDLFGNNRRYVSERFDFGGENNILVGDEISVYLDANNPEHYYVDIFSGKIK